MAQVYALIDPRTSEPFYVGSTNRLLEERLHEHLTSKLDRPRVKHIEELRSLGLKPIAVVLFTVHRQWQFKTEFLVQALLSRFYTLKQDVVVTNVKKNAGQILALMHLYSNRWR